MYYHGSFINRRGSLVTVHILTNSDRSKTIEIGEEASGVFFTDDPVEITGEVNDTFDVLIRHSAVIRLLCRSFTADFFHTSCRDAIVNVYRDNRCVFAGFIEPQSYSQPYNDVLDEIEINCIDALSALQYSRYKNIGSLGVLYEDVKRNAGQRTFSDILTEILTEITRGIDIVGGSAVRFLYDSSKSVTTSGQRFTVLQDIAIADMLFLGAEEDEVWQQDEVAGELLKYLNLHIVQDGFDFFVFSWSMLKRTPASSIAFREFSGFGGFTRKLGQTIISLSNVVDCDTEISIGEVYNQLLLTCKVEEIESVIESPLDDELLDSPYDNKQRYMTEYASDGNGKSAYDAFYQMTHNGATNYGAGTVTDWYMRVRRNVMWTFYADGATDVIDRFCKEGKNQQALPNYLSAHPGAAIMSFGSVKTNTANDDNSLISKVNMTDYLVLSVNGNEIDNDERRTYPNAASIRASIPYAVYNGNSTGGVFSPPDDETTNYIVISGRMVLNPIMKMTGSIDDLRDKQWSQFVDTDKAILVWHKTVPSRNNGDGRYYTRQYWRAGEPKDEVTWDRTAGGGFCPFTDEGPKEYEFKYSAIGDSTDKISKVGMIACMLIIGDKCVVETGTSGMVTDFEWRKYKPLEQCRDEDEYYQQSFTIGFNPKIGDMLIGQEYDLQNNLDYKMGVDAEGTAIPIRKADKVSGVVKFVILGPVNATWDVFTRRHATFFRHTRWGVTTVPLLAHVSSIMIKQFEVKVYSDNGLIDNGAGDTDIVYMSDTQETFTNKKDDIEFKINSALTAEERKKLGVTNTIKMSAPVNARTGDSILQMYEFGNNTPAKPEQMYVDSYYREYHKPRIQMVQRLTDNTGEAAFFHLYKHPSWPGKYFYNLCIGRNLMDGSIELKLKEIDRD